MVAPMPTPAARASTVMRLTHFSIEDFPEILGLSGT
jgi:hypothetical protein